MLVTVRFSRRALRAAAGICLAAAAPAAAGAQMLGLPVLQNAFVGPGLTVAGNFGTGGSAGSSYGGAAAWAPATGRFQLSGGLAMHKPDMGEKGVTYGLRAAMPLTRLMGGALGVAGFAGIGFFTPSDVSSSQLPIGVAAAYRMAFGGRGVSLFGAPYLSYVRSTPEGGETATDSRVRVSGGIDVSLTSSIGATVGFDGGSGGSLVGLGVSFAPGRR